MQLPRTIPIKLHEHKVPNFNVAIEVIVGTARRPAGHMGAMVVKYFGAGPARSGVTHLPKIVFV